MNTVLVVDNELEVRSTLCRLLNGGGFNPQYAANGREAIEKYRRSPIDVVVLSHPMPEMDAHEIVRRLKQLDDHVTVVILTDSTDMNHDNLPPQVDGACHYLDKSPASAGVIVSAINGALENRRLRLENRELMSQLQALNQGRSQPGKGRADLGSKNAGKAFPPVRDHLAQQLYQTAPVGVCQLDNGHRITSANTLMAKILGMPPDRLAGRSIREIHPLLSRQLLPVCHRIRKTGNPMNSYTISLDGAGPDAVSDCWLVSSFPLHSQEGDIVATNHFFQDMTELRNAQEKIRFSKIMLQSVFDGISDPLVLVDGRLRVCMLNQAARRYHRVRQYEDLLDEPYDLFGDPDQNQGPDPVARSVASGKAVSFERPGQMDNTKIEKVTIYPLCPGACALEGAIIQITDITETRSLENRILQNEKLASLGLLVSGVAHEINNPNNFIMFNVPILKSYMKAVLGQMSKALEPGQEKEWFGMSFIDFSQEVFRLIGNLEHGTHRIADIVDNLRTLVQAECGGKSRQPCHLTEIVRQVDSLCRSEIERHVSRFEVQCSEHLPLVQSDPAALEQVLINLLINAAHAANKTDSSIRLTVAPVKGAMLQLKVEDNGAGMDRETLAKIFDPFFTTKDPGLGTGLGLSVCHSLVTAMGGSLDVKSVVDTGTVFKVRIPIKDSGEQDTTGLTQAIDRQDPANPTYA